MLTSEPRAAPVNGRLGMLDGRYRIVRVLHVSADATLQLATETRLNRPVAIKTIDDAAERGARFSAIVQVLARLDHPNAINVIDTGTTSDGKPYAVMPFVEGERLRDIIARGPLPPVRAAIITSAILRGLAPVHRAGVVHRDLTPECVIVPPNDDAGARITGFWSALVPGPGESGGLSVADLGVGTPEYSSPEQSLGMETDERSDLYSVGILLYEMLHGAPPFASNDPFHVVQLQVHSPLPPIDPMMPDELATLLLELTQKEPGDRPASANEALIQIEAYIGGAVGPSMSRRTTTPVDGLSAAATSPYPAPRATTAEYAATATDRTGTREIPPRRSWALPAAALLLLGLGAGAWAWSSTNRGTPTSATTEDATVRAASPAPAPAGGEATGELSATLRALAIVNERRPEYAAKYVERRALIAELVAAGHAAKIDERLQTALDLLQAGQSPTPCTTFAEALTRIEAADDAYYEPSLAAASVPSHVTGAGTPPDASCEGIEARLAAARAPAVEAPRTAPVEASSPIVASREPKSKSKQARGSKSKAGPAPSASTPATPSAKPASTGPSVTKLDDPPAIRKLDDGVKRL